MIISGDQLLFSVIASLAAGGGIGYYVGHRGFPGVGNDLNDIKKDINDLKAKIKAKKSS